MGFRVCSFSDLIAQDFNPSLVRWVSLFVPIFPVLYDFPPPHAPFVRGKKQSLFSVQGLGVLYSAPPSRQASSLVSGGYLRIEDRNPYLFIFFSADSLGESLASQPSGSGIFRTGSLGGAPSLTLPETRRINPPFRISPSDESFPRFFYTVLFLTCFFFHFLPLRELFLTVPQ